MKTALIENEKEVLQFIFRELEAFWRILRGRRKLERCFIAVNTFSPLQCTVTLNFSLKVMDKLAKISKLKEEVAGGKQLEKNQLEMISKEKELTEELKMLQL